MVLPSSVSVNLRRASSRSRWRTERAAKKDAAFFAYSALYESGLLNENLLPLCHDWHLDLDDESGERQIGSIEIPPQIDIWSEMGINGTREEWHETVINIVPPEILQKTGETRVWVLLTTPGRLCAMPLLSLSWAPEKVFMLKFGQSAPIPRPNGDNIKLLQDTTRLFYNSARSDRLTCCNGDFITLFSPCLRYEGLEDWLQMSSKQSNANDVVGSSPTTIVRVPHPNNPPYIFHEWSVNEGRDTIICERLPRRRNFLAPAVPPRKGGSPLTLTGTLESRLETFPAKDCTFDGLHLSLVRIGLFMPAILQHIEDFMIADRLGCGLLNRVPFSSPEHIITAICAPSANRQTNYQRFEFFGDSVLKFIVSCHLFASEPNWHEGFLSLKRARLVSNSNLAGAALRNDLSHYIINEPIPYHDWALPVTRTARERRKVSRKMLADVVEALIGAAWMASGINAARKCINIFLPTVPSNPTSFALIEKPKDLDFGPADEIEGLIGYNFHNRALLLEALTHPSCGGHSRTDSYQRLEYLGDAILDVIIAHHMAIRRDHLSPGRMTQLKAALVNARFLGFLCLDLRSCETHRAVQTNTVGVTSETTGTRELHLVRYMRFASSDLAVAQQLGEERYALHRDSIRQELDSGRSYPWAELLRLRPEKFYSDIIESVLGAIYLDAGGNPTPCVAFVDRIGLQVYMDRLIKEKIDVLHPRERVQRWAGARRITYNVQQNQRNGRYRCTLLMDDVNHAEVDECYDREEAIARVAIQFQQKRFPRTIAVLDDK